MSRPAFERQHAEALLEELVAIPSPSHQEAHAARFLTQEMQRYGLRRAAVDGAGNAVGELGESDATRRLILLGHIDTVAGVVPVRRELTAAGAVLYGRGSVDAKGPLVAFTAVAARLGDAWAQRHGVHLVVAGAVEEEGTTSRGARFLARRFDGSDERRPDGCIIGEPSGWDRITLGYKGRLLIELRGERRMSHTAGPGPGLADLAARLYGFLEAEAKAYNPGSTAAFDRLQPSLRTVSTDSSDAFYERISALYDLRLPPDYDAGALSARLADWAARMLAPAAIAVGPGGVRLENETTTVDLAFRDLEAAWREQPRGPLVRSLLGAVREQGGRPRFVVKTGTSDMNVVAPVWRCPIVAYGAGDSRLDHTPDEHLPLDELWRSIEVLEAAIRRWADLATSGNTPGTS